MRMSCCLVTHIWYLNPYVKLDSSGILSETLFPAIRPRGGYGLSNIIWIYLLFLSVTFIDLCFSPLSCRTPLLFWSRTVIHSGSDFRWVHSDPVATGSHGIAERKILIRRWIYDWFQVCGSLCPTEEIPHPQWLLELFVTGGQSRLSERSQSILPFVNVLQERMSISLYSKGKQNKSRFCMAIVTVKP
jgi:hypothetical protein